MYAIVATGGKQLKVAAGEEVVVEKLDAQPGDSVTFDVLFLADDDTITVDPEALASAKDLLASERHSHALFVDARSQDKFRQAHIPSSLNLPLFTLKTKAFLRAKPLVLLNEGHNDAELLREQAHLAKAGFGSVQVLAGGIRAWQQQGGTLEGERVDSPALAELSAAQFHHARAGGGWLVVDVTNRDADQANLPRTIASALAKAPHTQRVLLVNPHGERWPGLREAETAVPNVPVFCLAGGTAAYNQFLTQQLAMQDRRLVTLNSQSTAKPSGDTRSGVKSGGCCGGSR